MRVLVPVKRVPDYEAKIRVREDGQGIVTDGVKWIVNPFDEIAVEEAVRIKESFADTEIVVASIGPAEATEQIRAALAMGADKGLLVQTEDYVDSDCASRILGAVARREQYDLIIMGKQAIDSDAHQCGQLLAYRLGWAQATCASALRLPEDGSGVAEVDREVDGGIETIKVTLPAVVTTDLRLNEPRYPSLPNIIKAKKKSIEQLTLEDLGTALAPKVRVLKLTQPAERKAGIRVKSVAELVEKLANESGVL
jgi:electron transfer flavoprotein beta subunit